MSEFTPLPSYIKSHSRPLSGEFPTTISTPEIEKKKKKQNQNQTAKNQTFSHLIPHQFLNQEQDFSSADDISPLISPMGTERLNPLHNFTMPCTLRWGNQRHVRCMKVNSNGQVSPLYRCSAADHHRRRTARERDPSSEFHNGSDKLADEGDDGISAVREKVMFDLQTAADKMKESIFKDGLEEGEVRVSVSPQRPPESSYGEPQRPWNLRTRRPACKTLVRNSGGGASATYGGGNGGDGKGMRFDVPKSLMRGTAAAAATVMEKSSMLRGGDGGGSGVATASGEKNERAKFSVALSKKEIEEDFSVLGLRLPRRPKKRPKMVQKQLDTLFPGLWLTEVTPDMYKVPDAAP